MSEAKSRTAGNPATTVRYSLTSAERVTLKIYNLLGAEVATLVNDEQKAAGYHTAVWDERDKAGRVVTSGVYVYRLRAGSFSATKKLVWSNKDCPVTSAHSRGDKSLQKRSVS